jgi:hypothetical protein
MTTRRTRGTDRLVTVLLGAALLAAGLLVWDWKLDVTGLLAGPLDLSGTDDVVTSAWWPWAAAAVGVLLGVLGLVWLLAHRPRLTRGTSRLAESDPTGRLEVDRSSLASTLAERWGSLAPVTSPRGRVLPDAPEVVELSAHVEVEADAESLVRAAADVEREVAAAFPGGAVRVRFLLHGPARQPRTRRTTEIAVQE